MDSVNNTFIWNDQLVVIRDSLLRKIDSCQSAFQLFHHSDSILRQQVILRDSAVAERDRLITAQKDIIKHREKQITRLKWHRGLLGTLDVVLVGVIGYLVIFR